jgi:hypothetical protein
MRRFVTLFSTAVILGASPSMASAAAIALQNATATDSQATTCPSGDWDVSRAIDGLIPAAGTLNSGWAIAELDQANQCLVTSAETAWFETAADQGSILGTVFTFTLHQVFGNFHTLGAFELSYTIAPRVVGGFSDSATWVDLPLATAVATNGAILTISGNEIRASGGFDINGNPPDTSVYTITTAPVFAAGITGFRLGTLLDAAYFENGPGRQPTNGNFVLTEFVVEGQDVQGPAVVPEPATLTLLGLGVAVLGRRLRAIRRR